MEKNNQLEFNFILYFIGGSEMFDLNKHFCDTYIKFSDSEDLFYVSFYSEEYIRKKINEVEYFWNTDTILVQMIERKNLYRVISMITNNGYKKHNITDNFTRCGSFQDILGDKEDIDDMINI
jgi:hypothetical protein